MCLCLSNYAFVLVSLSSSFIYTTQHCPIRLPSFCVFCATDGSCCPVCCATDWVSVATTNVAAAYCAPTVVPADLSYCVLAHVLTQKSSFELLTETTNGRRTALKFGINKVGFESLSKEMTPGGKNVCNTSLYHCTLFRQNLNLFRHNLNLCVCDRNATGSRTAQKCVW